MNILFVTEHTQDAGMIGHELTSLIPDLHLDISSDVEEAIGLSTVPGRFSAVLLDPELQAGDPLALIRALRAQNVPVAIIGLAGPTDLHSVARVMGAGADDYVLKRAGFVGTLPAVLRRARERYEKDADGGSSPRLLYAGHSGELTRESILQLKRVSGRHDTTGATRFLLRNELEVPTSRGPAPETDQHGEQDTSDRIPSHESGTRLQEEAPGARSISGEERRVFEDPLNGTAEQLRAAEEGRGRAQEGLQALEIRLSDQAEDVRAERQQWEQWRRALELRLVAGEESRATLEQAVLAESARQEQLAGQYSEHVLQIENAKLELEQERCRAAEEKAGLQAALQAAEDRIGRQAQQHEKELEQLESTRLHLEQQCRELEVRIATLEEASSGLEAKHRETLAQEQKSRLELEHSAAVVHDLRAMVEEHAAESIRWKSARSELERRQQLLEEELETAKRKGDELLETREHYRVKWEGANADLEELRSGLASVHTLAREAADVYQVFLNKLRNLETASTPSGAADR